MSDRSGGSVEACGAVRDGSGGTRACRSVEAAPAGGSPGRPAHGTTCTRRDAPAARSVGRVASSVVLACERCCITTRASRCSTRATARSGSSAADLSPSSEDSLRERTLLTD